MWQVFLSLAVTIDVDPFLNEVLVHHVVDVHHFVLDVLLHNRVNGGIDPVAALVDTLEGLIAVDVELLLEEVDGLVHHSIDLPGVYLLSLLHFLEVYLRVELFVLRREGVEDFRVQVFLILVVGDSAVFVELPENVALTDLVVSLTVNDNIAVLVLGHDLRSVILRTLWDSGQYGCLRNCELLDILTEITCSCQLDTVDRSSEADVVEVLLKDLVLRVGLLQLHGGEDLTDLTLRRMLIIACQVFDELLSDRRTTLFGIVYVQEHIYERRECTLVVNTVVGVETLVLGVNEGIADVLRDPVDSDGDTLHIGLHAFEDSELGLAVLVDLSTVEVGIASGLKLLERDAGGVLHKVENVHGKSSSHDRTGDYHDQEERQQGGSDDHEELLEEVENLAVLFLFPGRSSSLWSGSSGRRSGVSHRRLSLAAGIVNIRHIVRVTEKMRRLLLSIAYTIIIA